MYCVLDLQMFPHFIDDGISILISQFLWNFGVILKSRLSKVLEMHHFQLTIFIFLFIIPRFGTCYSFFREKLIFCALYFSVIARITLSGYCLNAAWIQACRPLEDKTMLFMVVSTSKVWLNKYTLKGHMCFFVTLSFTPHGPVEVERSKVDDSGQAFCHVLDSHSRNTA